MPVTIPWLIGWLIACDRRQYAPASRPERVDRQMRGPTGYGRACVRQAAVAVQQERSRHENRAKAMQMLKGRLYELELEKRCPERLAAEASKTDIGWGHQIRSYVLQPYQMVKDLRTGVERSDPQKVLDGDLDEFTAASLAARVGEGKKEEAKG